MDTNWLIDRLTDPAAYPEKVAAVEVRHTHISAVFLAGGHVYKVKKPVNPGFLDFTTLEKRKFYCIEEVRLNRRLAPRVYLGVVPIVPDGDGLRVEGEGEPVEWAVKMERLPDDATLLSLLRRGDLETGRLAELGRRLAAFHRDAEGGSRVAACGRFPVVAANARDNLTQSAGHVGRTLTQAVFERLGTRLDQALTRLHPLIESRAARGVPRDTHGDLHLDHIYLFPDRTPPDDVVAIDCVEFSERFRFADPVADIAFLVMDLRLQGRADLAGAFADAYFAASGDAEGRELLPFYVAYRAAIRGKVDGIKAAESEVPADSRRRATNRACAHWLLALGELEEPGHRPALILVGGLPGTGKSTLARALVERDGGVWIRSDAVRKELAGVQGSGRAATFEGGIYTPEWTDRTYVECLRRAEEAIADGGRAVVDATFGSEARRMAFADLALGLGVPCLWLNCRAEPGVVRERLAARKNDVSDADWAVYQVAAKRWEPPGERMRALLREVDTTDPHAAAAGGLGVLREMGLG